MTLTKLIEKSVIGGLTLMGLSLLSQPAQAINWNLSYTADNVGGTGVAGTVNAILTTNGTDYNTTNTYTITSISGTAAGSNITGLWTTFVPNTAYFADNQFKWNGTTGIVLSSEGIAFSNSASRVNNIFNYNGLYNFSNSTSGGNASASSVSSLSLTPATPVPWETDALPVIGSTILFGLGIWAKNKAAKPLRK